MKYKIYFDYGTEPDSFIVSGENEDTLRKEVNSFFESRGLNLKEHYKGSEKLSD